MAKHLKLGLNTGYWGGGPLPGVEDSIAEAEELGLDSIWVAEAYGSDCIAPLAWWGAKTERLKLGTSIMQMSARQPAAAAMAAMAQSTYRAVRPNHVFPFELGQPGAGGIEFGAWT